MTEVNDWWKDENATINELKLKGLITKIKIEALGLKYSLDNSIFTKNAMSNSVNRIIEKCNEIK